MTSGSCVYLRLPSERAGTCGESRSRCARQRLPASHGRAGPACVNEQHPEGDVVFRHACKLGAEGIVLKRPGSRYPIGPIAGLVEVQEPEGSCGGRRRRIAVKRSTIIDPIAKRKAVTKVTLIKYSIRLPPRAKANPTLCKSGGLPEGGCTHLGDVRLRSDLFRCMRSSRNAERGL